MGYMYMHVARSLRRSKDHQAYIIGRSTEFHFSKFQTETIRSKNKNGDHGTDFNVRTCWGSSMLYPIEKLTRPRQINTASPPNNRAACYIIKSEQRALEYPAQLNPAHALAGSCGLTSQLVISQQKKKTSQLVSTPITTCSSGHLILFFIKN
jgi:hypothetical protein